MRASRKIIAIGGGLLRKGETKAIDRFIVEEVGKSRPSVLFVPTASRDLNVYCSEFKDVYSQLGCEVNTLLLFDKHNITKREVSDLISAADIIYVGGGDCDLLMKTWKRFNVASHIQEAYIKGTILAGLSAGCAIWYEYFIEADEGGELCLKPGLGLLDGTVIPHFTDKIFLLKDIKKIIGEKHGVVTAIEDKSALLYENEIMKGVVDTHGAKAFTIDPPYDKKKKAGTYIHK